MYYEKTDSSAFTDLRPFQPKVKLGKTNSAFAAASAGADAYQCEGGYRVASALTELEHFLCHAPIKDSRIEKGKRPDEIVEFQEGTRSECGDIHPLLVRSSVEKFCGFILLYYTCISAAST